MVRTTGTAAAMQMPSERRNEFLALWIFTPVGLFAILLGCNDRGKRSAQHAALAIAMTALILLAGCAGTSAGTESTQHAQVTPPGTYILTVLSNSETTQHSVRLTLKVQ